MAEEKIGNPENPRRGEDAGASGRGENAGRGDAGGGAPQLNPAIVQGSSLTNADNPLYVKISAYEGPLDLLLDLIKKNEMDIYNIPIAEITKQYLGHLARMKELNLEIAGEFIVMAATLIYIKSKMLLPQAEDEEDEEGADPRAELVRRLLEYQAFKEAAKELGSLEDEQGKVFTRQITDYYWGDLDGSEAEIDTFSANLYDLLTAFQSLLSRSGRDVFHEVYEEEISIEEKMMEIRSRLMENPRLAFSSLFARPWSRSDLIATFLAVLEIVRTKVARVSQERHFGEIILERVVSQ